jgi:sec-independent protein translocase protein TatB
VFNLSGTELVFIAVLGLIVLGPEKLPSAMRRAGKIYREVRSISGNVQREVQKVMDEPMRQMKSLVEEPASETKKVAKQVNDIFAGKMPHLAQPRKDASAAPADPNDGSVRSPDEPGVGSTAPAPPPDTEAGS